MEDVRSGSAASPSPSSSASDCRRFLVLPWRGVPWPPRGWLPCFLICLSVSRRVASRRPEPPRFSWYSP